MSGFFGSISKEDCVSDVFYGTDYHSHLGTKRAGMTFFSKEKGFQRKIHNLENSYFRNKFESAIENFSGKIGIGVISDTDAQPIQVTSHLGKFAVATVCKIVNIDELEKRLLSRSTDNVEAIQTRIEKAKYELEFAKEFDVVIVNDDLQKTKEDVRKLVSEFLDIK